MDIQSSTQDGWVGRYGRRQPGWVYTSAEIPALPEGCPGWLSEVVLGLLRSDHCEEERRLTPAQAVEMLEVGGVAQQWEARQEAERREQALQAQLERERRDARQQQEVAQRELAQAEVAQREAEAARREAEALVAEVLQQRATKDAEMARQQQRIAELELQLARREAQKAALEAQQEAQQDAASAALAQQLQQQEELEQRRRQQPAAAAAAAAAAPEPCLPVLSETAAVEMVAAAQPEAAAGGRAVVRDAAALRVAVADRGGAPVVELDPAGGVFALGTEGLEIERPVRLVSGAGGRATLGGGEGGGLSLVVVESPGVALEGLALVAGTDEDGDQQKAVWVDDEGGEVELRGCDVTGAVDVYGTAALRDCAVHGVTNSANPGVYVNAEDGAGRATLERCTIERCAGEGVRAAYGGVARLVETTVRECEGDDYCTMNGGVIEGVAPELVVEEDDY
eukprot:COSAG01_NODE_5358_length_4312_cov_76.222882_3_plen_454_part_00